MYGVKNFSAIINPPQVSDLFRIGAAISIRIVCKHEAPSDWVSWNQIQSNYNGQSKERENTFKSQWEFEI